MTTPQEKAREKIKAWLAFERDGDTNEHPGDHELFNIVDLALLPPQNHVRLESGDEQDAEAFAFSRLEELCTTRQYLEISETGYADKRLHDLYRVRIVSRDENGRAVVGKTLSECLNKLDSTRDSANQAQGERTG